MPWRMIAVTLLLVLVVVFIGFNLDNRSNVSFGFATLEQVPVYLSILTAFATGMLVVLPLALIRPKRKRQQQAEKTGKGSRGKDAKNTEKLSAELEGYGID